MPRKPPESPVQSLPPFGSYKFWRKQRGACQINRAATNYQPKKDATFSKNDVCKFLLEAADQKWILQKVVLMIEFQLCVSESP
jgi:hypothetical protein